MKNTIKLIKFVSGKYWATCDDSLVDTNMWKIENIWEFTSMDKLDEFLKKREHEGCDGKLEDYRDGEGHIIGRHCSDCDYIEGDI